MGCPRRPTAMLLAVALLGVACQPDDDPAADPPPVTEPDEDVEGGDEDTADGDEDRDAPPDDEAADEPTREVDDEPVELTLTDLATALEAPWDVVEHDGRLLVTERDSGRLLEVDDADGTTEVRSFAVDATGEGGLLGLESDGASLFVYYTGEDGNRIIRLDDLDGDEQPLLTGIPKGPTHNGGRLVLGPDDHLYIGTGDAGDPATAQDPGSLAGKVLRVTTEGEVPDDNPFGDSPVWAIGLRNVQGLAFDGEGRLWAAELGPDVDDEINLIEPGADYGWPEVTGAPGVDGAVDAAFVAQPPEASWSGAAVLRDGAIPQWEGELFVAALRGERLWRLSLDGDEIVDSEELYAGEYGRLRTVRQAPDGALWLLTTNRDGRGSPADGDDRLLRIGP